MDNWKLVEKAQQIRPHARIRMSFRTGHGVKLVVGKVIVIKDIGPNEVYFSFETVPERQRKSFGFEVWRPRSKEFGLQKVEIINEQLVFHDFRGIISFSFNRSPERSCGNDLARCAR